MNVGYLWSSDIVLYNVIIMLIKVLIAVKCIFNVVMGGI